MKHIIICLTFIIIFCLLSANAWAQDSAESHNNAPISLDLDEEKLSIEADIPSVDLILSFKELQERAKDKAQSFLGDIVESAKHEPF